VSGGCWKVGVDRWIGFGEGQHSRMVAERGGEEGEGRDGCGLGGRSY